MDGIGACSKALERLGIDYEIADYVEIDKYAVKSFNAIHNTKFEPQDICKWDKDIQVDLIMHGSPCQDFSLAGKQAGGNKDSGTRSSLMYETIRIVEKLRPRYVIWENVKNLLSNKHIHNFNTYLEIMERMGYTNYYQVLNAKDYGIPQNRERVFTVSILDSKEFEFPQKQPLQLKLKDMLEDNVDEKYYLAKHLQDSFNVKTGRIEGIKFNCRNKINDTNGIVETLCAAMGEGGNTQPKIIVTTGKCIQVGTLPCFSYESDGRVYSPSGISPCLRAKEPNQKIDENDGVLNNNNLRIRKLTPKECWRLMGFDDADFYSAKYGCKIDKKTAIKIANNLATKIKYEIANRKTKMSNTQLYKQAGNSIVVNVLEAILKNLLEV